MMLLLHLYLHGLLLAIKFKNAFSDIVVISKEISSDNGTDLICPMGNSSGTRVWEYSSPDNIGSPTVLSETGENFTLTSLSQVGKYECKISDVSLINYTVAYLDTPVIPVSIIREAPKYRHLLHLLFSQ